MGTAGPNESARRRIVTVWALWPSVVGSFRNRGLPSTDTGSVRVDGSGLQSLRTSWRQGFSEDFQQFLADNGYGHFDFARSGAPGYGGRASREEKVTREPVILVHGNSDTARGWRPMIDALKADGYQDSEIYALTYGPGNPALAAYQHHSKDDLEDIRAFVEAVLKYTGAPRVDVISHSLGVTLTRKALKGGEGCDLQANCYDLGDALTDRVDAFVGIAGANHGLSSARGFGAFLPTGNRISGLHPDSKFLSDLNDDPTREAQRVYSIGGRFDQILGRDAGKTNRIPREDNAIEGPWGHFGARALTSEHQLRLIQKNWPTDQKKDRQARTSPRRTSPKR